MKGEHFADEEKTAPDAPDEIRTRPDEQQAANAFVSPGQKKRQGTPEVLQMDSHAGLNDRKGRRR
ncbi:MAG: hypothetical protein U0Z53_00435 [Blastocatellia bacterium]